MNGVEILQEEWANWKQEKVTREFLKRLFEKREMLKEGLAEGQATGIEQERTIGQCQAYKDIINYGAFEFEVAEPSQEKD